MSNTRKLDQIKKRRKSLSAKTANADLRVLNRFMDRLDALIASVPQVDAAASIVDNLHVIRHVMVAECVHTRGGLK